MNRIRTLTTILALTTLVVAFVLPQTWAQGEKKIEPHQTLITSVNVWDGTSDSLKKDVDVLVEGNPLEDVSVMAEYKENIKMIMKDGKLFKNTL